MTMTSRRKTKKNSSEGSESSPSKRGSRAEATTSSPNTSSHTNAAMGRRRTRGKASPSEAPASPPSKTRRKATPEAPQRSSPRGRQDSTSPASKKSPVTPSRRGRGRRGSTDSEASSIGAASVASSTPSRSRRRRGSNSSGISATSDTSQVTPTSTRATRSAKRQLSRSPPTVVAKKTNGSSPQQSPQRKKTRATRGTNAAPPSANGSPRGKKRNKSRLKTDTPENEDEEDQSSTEDGEHSSLQNSISSVNEVEEEGVEHGSVAENGSSPDKDDTLCDTVIQGQHSDSVGNGVKDGPKVDPESTEKLDTKTETAETNSESHEDNKELLPNNVTSELKSIADSLLTLSGKAEVRTCGVNSEPHTDTPAATSSHSAGVRRQRTDSDPSSSPETKPGVTKKARYDCKSEEKVLETSACIVSEPNTVNCPNVTPNTSEVCAEVMDSVTRLDDLLQLFDLTQEQQMEVCSLLRPEQRDLADTQLVELLVERQLGEAAAAVKSMNPPRFNKFLRQLLTHYCSLDTPDDKKHMLCEKAVGWARERRIVNLRHELELTLMTLYYTTKHYKQAETVATALYSETKKLQDKDKTVKACLCLSQVYHAMGNISKARANITTAKTEALKIYTPPDLQGELDLQSGIMQVAEGKDMETAYSYFKEAATGFVSRGQRSRALKYMLLAKIMVNKADVGDKVVRSQSHVQDIDEGVEAMLAIAAAANKSSLAEFRRVREEHSQHLGQDMVVAGVLDDLYTTMMEKNLLNIVLPYQRLQIVHVAERIGLPRQEVERRISQMILDRRIHAQLDHRDDCLYVYAGEDSDVVYQSSLKTLTQLDKTVSHLNRKVKKLL